MGRRAKRKFAFEEPADFRAAAPAHVCDKPGCGKPAEYRAPKDRRLTDYYWFCLEHVREYNAQWDYYRDMTPSEIEAELKRDVCWQRPTWRLGDRAGIDPTMFSDPLGLGGEAFGGAEQSRPDDRSSVRADPALIAAVKILETEFPPELKAVRASYKRLAKMYHPDSNGGDKTAEERFKDITEAYRLIIAALNVKKAG